MKIKTTLLALACFCGQLYGQENNPLINSKDVIIKGYELKSEKKYDEAIAEYKKIPLNDTNYALAMIDLAGAYTLAGKDSLAIELADKLIKERTRYTAQYYIVKGNAYDNLGRQDLAEKAYAEAEKLYPNDYLINFNRGVMLMKAEKNLEAEKCFQQVLKINPYHSSSLLRLAQVNIKFGRITPAMMCMQFYLLLDPGSERSKQVVAMLEQLVKSELDDDMTAKKPYGEQDDFSELDEIIKSKIALSDKYKSKTKLKFALTKQVQVMLEKLKYSKASAGFYMDFFAKFFEELNKNGHTETTIYFMLSGLKIDDVDKWMRSNDSKVKKLLQWAVPYIQQNLATYETELDGKRQLATHYFSDGVLKAVGNKDAAGNNTGYWKFYYNMYTPRSEGNFVNGQKEGLWKYYHKNGVLKEESNYTKGLYNGAVKEFHELGTISIEATYQNQIPQGMAYLYNIAGNKVNEFNLEKGIKSGKSRSYYSSGGIEVEANFVDGKGQGPYIEYYESGNVKEEGTLVNDMKNGTIISYHDAEGKPVEFKGSYRNNEPSGEWKFYNAKGIMTSEGVFDEKGKKNGKWKNYHDNGKLQTDYEYAKGEIDGQYNMYDTTGTLYATYVYKAGQLKEYTYTFNGKVVEKKSESGRELILNEYYFNGNPRKKGKYVSGKEDGKWEEFNLNGYKTSEYTYKNGVLQGDYIEYHPSGNVKLVVPYVDGQADGYSKRYHTNGQIEEEGWFVKGKRQGTWLIYFADGTPKRTCYYLNNSFYGWQQYNAVNGKLSYEEKYEYDQFVAIRYYDTTGKELSTFYLDKGTGTINGVSVTGQPRAKLNYKGGNAQGEFEWIYPNGKTDTKGTYHNDRRNGLFENFYPDGTKSAETNYRFGKLHGVYKSYYMSGKLKEESMYNNGDKEGMSKTYYESGQLYREDLYRDGNVYSTKLFDEAGQLIIHRKYYGDYLASYNAYTADQKNITVPVQNETARVEAYYANKMKSIECEYKNGVLTGKRNTYHSTGKPYEEETFVNGEEEGVSKMYYSTGKLKRESYYLNGLLNGVSTSYYPNGKVKSREIYRLNNLHGTCMYYNEQGVLLYTRKYYDDQLIEEK